MDQQPHSLPRWILYMIESWVSDRFQEELIGDLTEYYEELIEAKGLSHAKAQLMGSLFSYLRPYFFRTPTFSIFSTKPLLMFQFNSKLFFRQLKRRPAFSAINVLGLSMGIAACFFIFLFVQDELAFDSFHENKRRIQRIATHNKLPDSDWLLSARSSKMIAPKLKEAYPEVEEAVRLFNRWEPKILYKEQYIDQRSFFTESSLFSIFSFKLLQGDSQTCLDQPFTAVLTESMAKKYFNSLEIVGKTFEAEDSLTFQITGIVEDPPKSSHIQFDFLLSYSTWENLRTGNAYDWLNYWLYTYIKVTPETNAEEFESRIRGLVHDNFGDKMGPLGLKVNLELEALPTIYLYSEAEDQAGPIGNITTVRIFSGIGMLLLLLACFNFINLATARSMDRAIEVGIKKVVGSSKPILTRQFLFESIFICLISLAIGLALSGLLLPLFNSLSGKEIVIHEAFTLQNLLSLFLASLGLGIIAGAYPAWVLSSFQPIQTLVKRYSSSPKGLFLRKTLLVCQFAISLILIVATLVFFRQLNFLQQKDLGFDKDQVLVIQADGISGRSFAEKFPFYKDAIKGNPAIKGIAASSRIPGAGKGGGIMFPEGLPKDEGREFSYFSASPSFVSTLGIEILKGRAFMPQSGTEPSLEMLVNEASLESLGWELSDQVLGKHITAGWSGETYTIVGVYRDYHHISPREKIEPNLIIQIPSWYHYISLKINPSQTHEVRMFLEKKWQEWFPQYPFSYFFLDEFYNRQYQKDLRLSRLVAIFSVLAIFIACIGLFGLTLFAFQQRRKEIGIRKVLGASKNSLFYLLSKEFMAIVLIAFLAGIPLSYIAMSRWLENFAHSIELSPGLFFLAGAGLFAFSIMAIFFQTLSATKTQPILALRDE
ncbi:MAG: ABC transporter permease [Bacteroidota bacterium]